MQQANVKHRTYHVSTLSSRIHSALQQQQQLQNHRRIGTVPKALAMRPAAGPIRHNNNYSLPLLQHTNCLQSIHKRWHGGPHVDHNHTDSVHISFVDENGNPLKAHIDAYIGESLLQVAQRNDIELEGACEGVCACSTCHVIFPDQDTFDNVLEEASEDEEDMLDMAFGLTETSRLSCQIIVTGEMDGMEIEIPPATRNFYVDGHVPKPH
jgi:ferredoxin